VKRFRVFVRRSGILPNRLEQTQVWCRIPHLAKELNRRLAKRVSCYLTLFKIHYFWPAIVTREIIRYLSRDVHSDIPEFCDYMDLTDPTLLGGAVDFQ
jgi:hypothetical protein